MREAATRAHTPFERWIRGAAGSRGTTSRLYLMLTSTPMSERTRDTARWEILAGCTITPKQTELVWRDLHKSVRSMAGREAHYKILMDWYHYPVKIHRYRPGVSPHCWRGCAALGDARHIWWECPVVQPFWQEVAGALTCILGYPIPCEASVLLIGIRIEELENQYKIDRRIMWSCLSAAKTTVAFYWRKQNTPPITL